MPRSIRTLHHVRDLFAGRRRGLVAQVRAADWVSGSSGTATVMRNEELAQAIANELDGRSLATAESCTAGRLSAAFASVTSASEWFRGGLVAYQVAVKRELLGVMSYSVVTQHAACEMARGVAELFHTDVTVATTGVAGTMWSTVCPRAR